MCWRARAGVCCSIFSCLLVWFGLWDCVGSAFWAIVFFVVTRACGARAFRGLFSSSETVLSSQCSINSIILGSLDSRRKCPAGRRRDGDGSRGTPLLGRSRHPMGVETESRDGRPITTRRFPSAGCHKSAPIPYGVPGDVVILDDPLGNPALRNTCSRRSPVGVQTRHRPVLYRCQSTRLLAHSFVLLAH